MAIIYGTKFTVQHSPTHTQELPVSRYFSSEQVRDDHREKYLDFMRQHEPALYEKITYSDIEAILE